MEPYILIPICIFAPIIGHRLVYALGVMGGPRYIQEYDHIHSYSAEAKSIRTICSIEIIGLSTCYQIHSSSVEMRAKIIGQKNLSEIEELKKELMDRSEELGKELENKKTKAISDLKNIKKELEDFKPRCRGLKSEKNSALEEIDNYIKEIDAKDVSKLFDPKSLEELGI